MNLGTQSTQKTLFEDCINQRLSQMRNQFTFRRKNHIYFMLFKNKHQKDEEWTKFIAHLEKKPLLGLYNSNGALVIKIQPFQIFLPQHSSYAFQVQENQYFQDKGLEGNQYHVAIYRSGSDYAYRYALSKNHAFFQKRYYQSRQILEYMKGDIRQLKVDYQYYFEQDRKLNNLQLKAFNMSGLQRVMLIDGPPGVGKSYVGCKIALSFLSHKKRPQKVIMVTVTSLGARAMCYYMVPQLQNSYHSHDKHVQFVRLIKSLTKVRELKISIEIKNKIVEAIDFQIKKNLFQILEKKEEINFLYFNLLIPLEQYLCMQASLRYYTLNNHIIINLIKLTNFQMPIQKILLNLDKIANKLLVQKEFKELYKQAIRLTIKNADLIISNTPRAFEINRHQANQDEEFKPYLAIFDEAAQATLQHAYCLFELNIKRLIVIGDDKQQRPFSLTHRNNQQTLYSVFKRLKKVYNYCHFDRQYRMQQKIAQIVNYISYNGIIKNADTKNKKHTSQIITFQNYPVFFVDHDGYETSLKYQTSQFGFYNQLQCKLIKLHIDQLPDQELKNVGIITPYKSQQKKLKVAFEKQVKLGLSIATINGFQGTQKEYIIFSVVRSNARGQLGSSESKHKINVALSRAKKGLMIIGNWETLLQGNSWNPWKKILTILWHKQAVFKYTQQQIKFAVQTYHIPKIRDYTNQVNVEQAFDAKYEDSDQQDGLDEERREQKILIGLKQFENEQLPFIDSNYNLYLDTTD